jgi:hypothetical protein
MQTKQQLKLLDESIEAWQEKCRKRLPGTVVMGEAGCPLCQSYKTCTRCPVKMYSGERDCANTPFYAARSAFSVWARYWDAGPASEVAKAAAVWREAAKTEIRYLQEVREWVVGGKSNSISRSDG